MKARHIKKLRKTIANVYGYTLEEIAQMNLDKLAKRKQAGTIDGNGDGIYDR